MSSIHDGGGNEQLVYGAYVALGALFGKFFDWLITKFSTKATRQSTLEEQLWAEIHDLRSRYDALETKYHERIEKMQDDFNIQAKAFQRQIEAFQDRVNDLEDLNETLKQQVHVLENGKR